MSKRRAMTVVSKQGSNESFSYVPPRHNANPLDLCTKLQQDAGYSSLQRLLQVWRGPKP